MDDFWSVTENPGHLRLHSAKLSPTLFQAYNTLTQRTVGPKCAAEVTLRFAHMKNGDVAGISTFIGNYGFTGVKKETISLSDYDGTSGKDTTCVWPV